MTHSPQAGTALPLGALDMPLRDQVRDELRDRIAHGVYSPGTRLIERDVAIDLGVSRVPVREAFRTLEAEGFVQVVPRRGVIVTRLARKDVEELFDVREALEVLACRLAAGRITPDGLANLRGYVQDARAAVEAGDMIAVGRANAAFHDEIVLYAHNDLLASILEPLRARLHWLFRQIDDPRHLCQEHEELCEAIASGDGDGAAEYALQHVRTNRRVALHMLFGETDSAPAGSSDPTAPTTAPRRP